MKHNIIFVLTIVLLHFIFSSFTHQENDAISFIWKLNSGLYTEAEKQFSEEVRPHISPSLLEAHWLDLIEKYGKFKMPHVSCSNLENNYFVVYIKLKFKKKIITAKFIMNESAEILGFFFLQQNNDCKPDFKYNPPKYDKLESYIEKDLNIKSDTTTLFGTFCEPKSKSKIICIFLHGSGPNDRDESIGPNKVFRDIAVGLASHDIASYRFDKRTYTYQNNWENINLDIEIVNDAVAVVNHFKANPLFDSTKIILIAHSLSGMLSPKIASLSKVDGLVLLAANLRPLEVLIYEQFSYLFNFDKNITPEENNELTKLKHKIAYLNTKLSLNSPKDSLPLGLPASYWISLKGYDPLQYTENLNTPILLIQGMSDYQVTMKDFDIWKKALAGKESVTFNTYKNLNHHMFENEGRKNPPVYMNENQNVPKYLIKDIIQWIKNL